MIHNRHAILALAALLVGVGASAGERPPATAKPLLEIAAAVERAGFAPIVEASFEDGRWEIEAYPIPTPGMSFESIQRPARSGRSVRTTSLRR